MNVDIIQKISEAKNKFRILKDWIIIPNDEGIYSGQICINEKKRVAELFLWIKDDNPPDDFYIHEMLHVAFKALKALPRKNKYDAEEELVQDICKIILT